LFENEVTINQSLEMNQKQTLGLKSNSVIDIKRPMNNKLFVQRNRQLVAEKGVSAKDPTSSNATTTIQFSHRPIMEKELTYQDTSKLRIKPGEHQFQLMHGKQILVPTVSSEEAYSFSYQSKQLKELKLPNLNKLIKK
jgi:hypothetical protein